MNCYNNQCIKKFKTKFNHKKIKIKYHKFKFKIKIIFMNYYKNQLCKTQKNKLFKIKI